MFYYESDRVQLTKNNYNDAGFDIYSNEDTVIEARSSKLISTDLAVAVPNHIVAFLKSRSGLSVKHQLEVGAGVIDSTYRGEIKVHLYNHSDVEYFVFAGDKIAQLVPCIISTEPFEKVDFLNETERGNKGFGSTGYR